jgi:ATP-dependent Clp protease adaptor protein ClpS
MAETDHGNKTGLKNRPLQDVEEPPSYRVLLLNDDYTTMDFVVGILEEVFHKPRGEAMRIMLAVHRHGRGLAGVYTRQVAETKCGTVKKRARAAGFPLQCAMERE